MAAKIQQLNDKFAAKEKGLADRKTALEEHFKKSQADLNVESRVREEELSQKKQELEEA